MTAIDLTLAAVTLHNWQVVLLGKRSKKPTGKTWNITRDVDVIRRHVGRGGNIGLVCGPASGVAIPDGDDLDLMNAMFVALGALAIWVETGSGKCHCYVTWEPNLPAKLMWQGRKVGELQRGGIGPDGRPVLQQVVLPPSIHPDTGRAYRWRVDPCDPLPTLPPAWRAYLLDTATSLPEADTTAADAEAEPWDGPAAEELLRRAMLQPGASRRRIGVKFQCPGCAAEGHDTHRDNALVRLDGRWGCALNPSHRGAIAVALGVVAPDGPDGVMPGPDVKVTAADLDADWTGDF